MTAMSKESTSHECDISPRTYDLLHADHLLSKLKKRCKLAPAMAEVDRIVRPDGKIIVRDESSSIGEVENLLTSLHWEIRLTFSKDQKGYSVHRKVIGSPQLIQPLPNFVEQLYKVSTQQQ